MALITGEEKIVPPRPHYFVCTVEAMPLTREVEFLAVDEIQLAADPERGHVFTDRLLHARGRYETMLLGAATMAPLIRRLLPGAEIVARERFSQLTYDGPRKITRLPRRTAVVAFSADEVYAIAELIRRQRGGAAVVMGSLSPAHAQRPGGALPVRRGRLPGRHRRHRHGPQHGRRPRRLRRACASSTAGARAGCTAQEIGQIAGRAGRYRRDGTFGVTGACPDDGPGPGRRRWRTTASSRCAAAQWRNAGLDFASLADLLRSLAAPPPRPG